MCMKKKSQKEALDPLELKIEMWHLLDVGAGNWILVPCKSIKDLTAEPSPQPMIFNALKVFCKPSLALYTTVYWSLWAQSGVWFVVNIWRIRNDFHILKCKKNKQKTKIALETVYVPQTLKCLLLLSRAFMKHDKPTNRTNHQL